MEKKEPIKVSLSTFFLFIAIIVILVLGYFTFNLYTENQNSKEELNSQNNKISTLENSVKDYQSKIDAISNTINSNTNKSENSSVNQPNNSEKNNNSESSTSVSNNKDSINNKILGSWKAYKVVDSTGNDLGLNSVFGSGIKYSNEMKFKENGALSYMIGITVSSEDGEYTVDGNTIKYGIPTETKGELNWSTLTYIPEEDILKEELDWTGEKQIVTYIRAN